HPSCHARLARLHELHDLRLLQLAALLPRSPGPGPGVGGRGDQRPGRFEPHRGQRPRRAALPCGADADWTADGLGRGPSGAGGGVRPDHELLRRRIAVPGVRRGHRGRDARQAGIPQRSHPLGPTGDHHLARFHVREQRRGAGTDGLGLGGADALHRHRVGVERADVAAGHSALLDGAAARPNARRDQLDAQTQQTRQARRTDAAGAQGRTERSEWDYLLTLTVHRCASVRLVVAWPALLGTVLRFLFVLAHVPPVLPEIPAIPAQIARVAPRVRGIAVLHVLAHVPAILANVPGVVADILAVAAQLTAVVADFLAVLLHVVRILGRQHSRGAHGERQHGEEGDLTSHT